MKDVLVAVCKHTVLRCSKRFSNIQGFGPVGGLCEATGPSRGTHTPRVTSDSPLTGCRLSMKESSEIGLCFFLLLGSKSGFTPVYQPDWSSYLSLWWGRCSSIDLNCLKGTLSSDLHGCDTRVDATVSDSIVSNGSSFHFHLYLSIWCICYPFVEWGYVYTGVHLFVCLVYQQDHMNNDYHEMWMKDGSQPRTVPINFWCGSR